MWFYTCYLIHIYLLIFDGIPFATTTLAQPQGHSHRLTPSTGSQPPAPKPTVSVTPKDIWNELKEVTEGSINMDTKDRTP